MHSTGYGAVPRNLGLIFVVIPLNVVKNLQEHCLHYTPLIPVITVILMACVIFPAVIMCSVVMFLRAGPGFHEVTVQAIHDIKG